MNPATFRGTLDGNLPQSSWPSRESSRGSSWAPVGSFSWFPISLQGFMATGVVGGPADSC